jgi:hypothetical protein
MLKNDHYLSLEETLNVFDIKKLTFLELESLEENEYFIVIDPLSYSAPPPYSNFVLMKYMGENDKETNKTLCILEQLHFNNYCRRFIIYGEKNLQHRGYSIFNFIDYATSSFSEEIYMPDKSCQEIEIVRNIQLEGARNIQRWNLQGKVEDALFDFRIVGIPPFIYLGRFLNFLTLARLQIMFFYFPVKKAFFSFFLLEGYLKIPCILRKYERISRALPVFLN